MKAKKLLLIIIALIMCVSILPAPAFSQSNVVLTMKSDVEDGAKPKLAQNVTFTVAVSTNEGGFAVGTLFFLPSDNLEYVSATFKGEAFEAIKVGKSYGIDFVGDKYTETADNFCTITFKVIGTGNISVSLESFQMHSGEGTEFITPTINGQILEYEVEALTKPNITTSDLPDGKMDEEYSAKLEGEYGRFLTWALAEGSSLPEGLSLLPDGTVSGTPIVHGEFTFSVIATVLESVASDPKQITLKISESARRLELNEDSKYALTDQYIKGVTEKTSVSSFLENFKNKQFIKVFDSKGDEVTSDTAALATGYTVSIMNGDTKYQTLTVVVLGDVSGNGRIDAVDYQRLRLNLFGNYELEGAYLEAAKVSGKDKPTSVDYQRLRLHLFGTYNIYE